MAGFAALAVAFAQLHTWPRHGTRRLTCFTPTFAGLVFSCPRQSTAWKPLYDSSSSRLSLPARGGRGRQVLRLR